MVNQTQRRKHHRIKARWPLTLLTDRGAIIGETINITAYGIFIHCEGALPLKEIFRMSIIPPNHKAIDVTGKVIWSNFYALDDEKTALGMGICFVKISADDRHFLIDIVSAYPEE